MPSALKTTEHDHGMDFRKRLNRGASQVVNAPIMDRELADVLFNAVTS